MILNVFLFWLLIYILWNLIKKIENDEITQKYTRKIRCTSLSNQLGSIISLKNEKFILFYEDNVPILVSFRLPSYIIRNNLEFKETKLYDKLYPYAVLWKDNSPVPIENLKVKSNVMFDAVFDQSLNQYFTLLAWVGTKPNYVPLPLTDHIFYVNQRKYVLAAIKYSDKDLTIFNSTLNGRDIDFSFTTDQIILSEEIKRFGIDVSFLSLFTYSHFKINCELNEFVCFGRGTFFSCSFVYISTCEEYGINLLLNSRLHLPIFKCMSPYKIIYCNKLLGSFHIVKPNIKIGFICDVEAIIQNYVSFFSLTFNNDNKVYTIKVGNHDLDKLINISELSRHIIVVKGHFLKTEDSFNKCSWKVIYIYPKKEWKFLSTSTYFDNLMMRRLSNGFYNSNVLLNHKGFLVCNCNQDSGTTFQVHTVINGQNHIISISKHKVYLFEDNEAKKLDNKIDTIMVSFDAFRRSPNDNKSYEICNLLWTENKPSRVTLRKPNNNVLQYNDVISIYIGKSSKRYNIIAFFPNEEKRIQLEFFYVYNLYDKKSIKNLPKGQVLKLHLEKSQKSLNYSVILAILLQYKIHQKILDLLKCSGFLESKEFNEIKNILLESKGVLPEVIRPKNLNINESDLQNNLMFQPKFKGSKYENTSEVTHSNGVISKNIEKFKKREKVVIKRYDITNEFVNSGNLFRQPEFKSFTASSNAKEENQFDDSKLNSEIILNGQDDSKNKKLNDEKDKKLRTNFPENSKTQESSKEKDKNRKSKLNCSKSENNLLLALDTTTSIENDSIYKDNENSLSSSHSPKRIVNDLSKKDYISEINFSQPILPNEKSIGKCILVDDNDKYCADNSHHERILQKVEKDVLSSDSTRSIAYNNEKTSVIGISKNGFCQEVETFNKKEDKEIIPNDHKLSYSDRSKNSISERFHFMNNKVLDSTKMITVEEAGVNVNNSGIDKDNKFFVEQSKLALIHEHGIFIKESETESFILFHFDQATIHIKIPPTCVFAESKVILPYNNFSNFTNVNFDAYRNSEKQKFKATVIWIHTKPKFSLSNQITFFDMDCVISEVKEKIVISMKKSLFEELNLNDFTFDFVGKSKKQKLKKLLNKTTLDIGLNASRIVSNNGRKIKGNLEGLKANISFSVRFSKSEYKCDLILLNVGPGVNFFESKCQNEIIDVRQENYLQTSFLGVLKENQNEQIYSKKGQGDLKTEIDDSQKINTPQTEDRKAKSKIENRMKISYPAVVEDKMIDKSLEKTENKDSQEQVVSLRNNKLGEKIEQKNLDDFDQGISIKNSNSTCEEPIRDMDEIETKTQSNLLNFNITQREKLKTGALAWQSYKNEENHSISLYGLNKKEKYFSNCLVIWRTDSFLIINHDCKFVAINLNDIYVSSQHLIATSSGDTFNMIGQCLAGIYVKISRPICFLKKNLVTDYIALIAWSGIKTPIERDVVISKWRETSMKSIIIKNNEIKTLSVDDLKHVSNIYTIIWPR